MVRIGIVGAGAMGSAIGGVLVAHDCEVITCLNGRSAQSHDRALRTGMAPATIEDFASTDFVLSIVPPAQAADVVGRLEPVFAAQHSPIFVECNALAPATKRELESRIEIMGGRMIDGVIIGHPPLAGRAGPRLYMSGGYAPEGMRLTEFGLDARLVKGPVGAAAALKMCYGGLNKGITALTAAVMLASERAGIQDVLLEEFGISQRALLERSRSSLPAMYPKAHRWVAEFEEIATFMKDAPTSSDVFTAIARFFDDRSMANAAGGEQTTLAAALDKAPSSTS